MICFSFWLRREYIKFSFQNLGNGREYKNGRRLNTYVFYDKKKISIDFVKIELFSYFSNHNILFTSVFIFSKI